MHVAKAFIYDADGNILILRRSHTHPHYAFEPDLPGGIIEPGEDIIAGLVREVQEEAGLNLEPTSLTAAFENVIVGKYTRHLYVAKLKAAKPDVVISWEHDQYEWLPPAQILQKHTDADTDSYYAQAITWLNTRPQ